MKICLAFLCIVLLQGVNSQSWYESAASAASSVYESYQSGTLLQNCRNVVQRLNNALNQYESSITASTVSRTGLNMLPMGPPRWGWAG